MKTIAIATSRIPLPPSDQELAEALVEQGFKVHPAIWSDTQQDWNQFDAVIVRSCWDYHLRPEEFLAWIASLEQHNTLVLNEPDLIRWNTDKIYLAELAARGVAIPDTVFVKAGETVNLAQICASRNWRNAVVKPTISASAHQTELRSVGFVSGPAIVQQYIAAIATEGEWSLMYFNGRFSHAVIKRPNAGDFRVQREFGGTAEAAHPSPEAIAFGEGLLRQIAWLPVFARVDVVIADRSIVLMELEVIEPELFLHLAAGSSRVLASVIRDQLRSDLA